MSLPRSTSIRHIPLATRTVRWHCEVMGSIIFERGGDAFVKGFVVIVHLDPLCTKLGNLLRDVTTASHIWHDSAHSSTVFVLPNWSRRNDTGKRSKFALERCFGGHFHSEATLHDIAFSLDFGDRDKVALLGLVSYTPHSLAGDNDICAPQPGI